MTVREFLFGFKFSATDYVTPILKNISAKVESLNAQMKATASWREGAQNLAMLGAGALALGAGAGMVLKGMVSKAAEMDEAWRHLATGLDAGAAGVKELAEAHGFAAQMAVKFNYAQKDIVDNLYRAKSFVGDWNTALAVTANSAAVARGNLGDAATVGQSLGIIFNNWPGQIGKSNEQVEHLADLVAYTTRHGAFHGVNDLTAGLSVAAGSIKAAGLGAEDAMALLQAYSRVGMVGSEAGTAVMETLQAFSRGKLQSTLGVALATTHQGALDVIGTLVNLRRELGSGVITAQQFQRASAALGIRGERALAVDVNALVAFRKELGNASLIHGAAAQGTATMMGAFSEQIGVLGQKWEILSEHLGGKLLGPIGKLGAGLGWVLDELTAFADHYPRIAKYAVLGAGLGASVLVLGGGLAIASAALAGFVSFIPAITAFAGALRIGAIATKLWAAAQWLLNVAMDANPIGLAVIGIAALAAGVYALYRNWQWITENLSALPIIGSLIHAINFLRDYAPAFFHAGWNLVKAIGAGMLSGFSWPIHAIEAVASGIRAHLPFSPAQTGPLRDLNRVRIIETIAESIRPGPALLALRRTAAAIAIAVPMTLAPALVAPAFAATAGQAGAGGRAGASVVINYSPVINMPAGADARALLDVLRQHARELKQMLDSQESHEERRGF
jgi:TP901 family phage tail tape measure protein